MCNSIAQGIAGGGANALPSLPIVGSVQKKTNEVVNNVLPEKTLAGKVARTAQDLGPKLYN